MKQSQLGDIHKCIKYRDLSDLRKILDSSGENIWDDGCWCRVVSGNDDDNEMEVILDQTKEDIVIFWIFTFWQQCQILMKRC